MVVIVLFNAGLQLPVMPFIEVVGNGFKVSPSQIAATALNSGTAFGLTVMVNLASVAHSPEEGVKVYSVVTVLFSAGLQLPVMPFIEVVGNGLKLSPSQIGATEVKIGRTFGLTVMVSAVVVAHCPLSGVKV